MMVSTKRQSLQCKESEKIYLCSQNWLLRARQARVCDMTKKQNFFFFFITRAVIQLEALEITKQVKTMKYNFILDDKLLLQISAGWNLLC